MTLTVEMFKKNPKYLKADGTPDKRRKDNYYSPLWRMCKMPFYKENNRLSGNYLKIAKTVIWELQGRKCACCGNYIKVNAQLDHIIPFCVSFSNYYKNLQMLCANCHYEKSMEEKMTGVYKVA